MDFVGKAMGMATVPMALLSLASLLGAALLLVTGQAELVMFGIAAIALAFALAVAIEAASRRLDAAAWAVLCRRGRGEARVVAAIAGTLPMLPILAWEAACFSVWLRSPAPGVAGWLLSYGVALWPWTIFALAIHGDRRTLCGIRAYAAHIAYWVLSAAVLLGHAPFGVGVALMALPASLPVTVGLLLAIADREALRNVRI